MKKITKILTCGLIISSMASAMPAAYAKDGNCPYQEDTISDCNKIIDIINQNCGNTLNLENLLNNICDKYNNITPPQNNNDNDNNIDIPSDIPTNKPSDKPIDEPVETPTDKPIEIPTEKPQQPETSTNNASELENKVFELVNNVRAENGLSPLTWADDIASVARAHSKDMIANNYFSHTDLKGNSPFDRLKNNGINYNAAAENIAYGQKTAEAVMKSWMNSSGHRANILNANVKEIGIGAVSSNSGTIYWTQMFVAR